MNTTENNLPRETTLGMLIALNVMGKNIYPGTANPLTVARNRRRNKAARKARRTHRLAQ
jgi:hypothetical protein